MTFLSPAFPQDEIHGFFDLEGLNIEAPEQPVQPSSLGLSHKGSKTSSQRQSRE
jgi:hypothetical protein